VTFAAFGTNPVKREIRRIAAETELTLIVGAGASMESRLPGWDELLSRLLVRIGRDKMSDDEDAAATWAKVTLEADHSLGSAAVVAALTSTSTLQNLVVTELYEGRGAQAFVPGPIAREIARLVRTFEGRATVVTLNYDDLLERALETEFPDRPVRSITDGGEAPAGEELSVTHLHGFAADGIRGELILAEEQYQRMQRGTAWQETLMVERLNGSACLFIGTSLNDPNLIRYLHGYERPAELRHTVLFVRGTHFAQLDRRVQAAREEAVRARWSALGVRAVFLDHFSDVAQFVHEIGWRREQSTTTGVEVRASGWIGSVEERVLGVGDDDTFRLAQNDLSDQLRETLRRAVEAAENAGADFSLEANGVGLWIASRDGRAMTNWVSSDRAYQEYGTVVPIPIGFEKNWVSVETFIRGVRVQEDREVYASRWRYVRGLPIRIDHPRYGRILVGCITITSTRPGAATALEHMPEAVEARFHELLLEGAQSLVAVDDSAK
jgi:SIR2-like domain